jgi:hypothetical protein
VQHTSELSCPLVQNIFCAFFAQKRVVTKVVNGRAPPRGERSKRKPQTLSPAATPTPLLTHVLYYATSSALKCQFRFTIIGK